MAKENHNDNLDEDLDLEEEEEEEEADVEEDEDEEEDSPDGDDEEEEDEEEEDSEEDDDEDEDEDEDEDDEDLDPSNKFKGKSRKDILKAYRSLEKSKKRQVLDEAQKIAQKILANKGIKADKEDTEDGDDGEFDLGLTDEEIAKMKPSEFGRHLTKLITKKATEIAQNVIQKNHEVRTNVTREIHDATKTFPLLKENPGFRDVVITFIENAASKGEVLSLKEACKKAAKALGIKPGDKAPEKKDEGKGEKKPNRKGVEKTDGPDGKDVKTEEQKIKDGMMKGSSSSLGGLGI